MMPLQCFPRWFLRAPAALLILAFSLYATATGLTAADTRNMIVQGTLIADPGPSIELRWDTQPDAMVIEVDRRLMEIEPGAWERRASLTGSDPNVFVDPVEPGIAYEYRVRRRAVSGSGAGYTSLHTYLAVGTDLPLNDDRGIALLVVESGLETDMPMALSRLELDLVAEGWEVKRIAHGREGSESAEELRARIQTAFNADPSRTCALYLFGHLPVVYSGSSAPDGHEFRAHETDQFYSDVDDAWPDVATLERSGDDNEGLIPGDGRYDLSSRPYSHDTELMTGRVDFARMAAYKKGELGYLHDYVAKAHAWRYGHRSELPRRALAYNRDHLFHERMWLQSMYGPTNTLYQPFQPAVAEQTFIWASDFGELNGSSSYYTELDWRVFFTVNFGSYKQTWNEPNNPMRGLLARPDFGLSSFWGGRDAWSFHHMQAGHPIGFSERVMQNPRTDDLGRGRNIHHNLMGDPTLRLHPFSGASDLSLQRSDSAVLVSWATSPAENILGYNVYRAQDRLGPYQRLTETPVAETEYTDASAPDGMVFYQVRTVRWEETSSTRYLNESAGVFNALPAEGDAATAPVASNLSITVPAGLPIPLPFPESDEEGNELWPVILQHPEHAQMHWAGRRPFIVADANWRGGDKLTYQLFDGLQNSNSATIDIQVVKPPTTLAVWEMSTRIARPESPFDPSFRKPGLAVSEIGGTAALGLIAVVSPGSDVMHCVWDLFGGSDGPAYLHWTLTPDDGMLLSVESLMIAIVGPKDSTFDVSLQYSLDGFETAVNVPLASDKETFIQHIEGIGTGTDDGALVHFAVPGIHEIEQSVEFRLLFTNPSTLSFASSLGLGGLPFATDDLIITGSLKQDTDLSYAEWATSYNWESTADSDRASNPDGDVFSNFDEYIYGTNPARADAYDHRTPVRVRHSNGGVRLTFSTLESKYTSFLRRRFQYSFDLENWTDFDPATHPITRSVTIPDAFGDGRVSIVDYSLRLPATFESAVFRFLISE